MWNSKTLKIQITFQNWHRILGFQIFFYHIEMGYNVYDVWRKVLVY
jgi:hypothetical protein